ncbi:hypothetical protein ACH35V_18965 [Actinomadura sp. 1N219]|uniref:hypothetical protein n=1 Tax=Actinomadura sp. 1N219 TaxID=3375152 RepID=UPI00379DF261
MTLRQRPRPRSQQNPIPVVQFRPVDLTAQHCDLMPTHKNLDLLGAVTTGEQRHKLQDPTSRR